MKTEERLIGRLAVSAGVASMANYFLWTAALWALGIYIIGRIAVTLIFNV